MTKHQITKRSVFCNLWLPLMCVTLLFLFGCRQDNENAATYQFRKFVKSHEQLRDDPPAHQFRFISLNTTLPRRFDMSWGIARKYEAVFKVAVWNEIKPYHIAAPVDTYRIRDEMKSFLDVDKYDWIGGRNEKYGFGVKSVEGKFVGQGVKQSVNRVATHSSLGFALVYDQCLIRDLEQVYDITKFSDFDSPIFPDSIVIEVVHRIKNFVRKLYFNRHQGRFLGFEDFDNGEVTGRFVHTFEKDGSIWKPISEEVYFSGKNGKLKLDRIRIFLEWSLCKDFNSSECYLSFYGLPEPSFGQDPIPQRMWITIVGGLIFAAIAGSHILRKRKLKMRR